MPLSLALLCSILMGLHVRMPLSLIHPGCRPFLLTCVLDGSSVEVPSVLLRLVWRVRFYFPWVQNFFPPHPPPRNSEQLLEKPESKCSGSVVLSAGTLVLQGRMQLAHAEVSVPRAQAL